VNENFARKEGKEKKRKEKKRKEKLTHSK